MRIGILVSELGNGGAQRVAITLSRWLNEHGEEGIILTLRESTKNQYDDNNLNLVRLQRKYEYQSITKRLRVFDQENHIDVYLVMGIPMCVYVMPALRGTKAKIIVSERNDPRNFQGKTITKIISRLLMSKADGFVFQTNEAMDYYKKYSSKAVVIPNPVASVPNIKNRISNINREKTIVTMGRLVPQKNQQMLIRSFSRISGEFPEYKLVIYGEGVLENQLKEMSRELKIDDRVLFPGSVNDVHQRIINAELFVLSSDFEGMPNALMEAMAMGLTCISTDCPCGGPRDIIEDGINGYLIPVGDIDKCAMAISKALKEKESSDKVGERALQVREKYKNDTICLRWLEYIKSVAGKYEENAR